MLQKLLEKFEEERTVLEKEETNAAHAFSLLAQDLNNQIASANGERNRKQEEKSSKEQSSANAQSDLGETTESRNSDSAYLAEITNQCHNKAAEFESRQPSAPVRSSLSRKRLNFSRTRSLPRRLSICLPSSRRSRFH